MANELTTLRLRRFMKVPFRDAKRSQHNAVGAAGVDPRLD
jgi:hypothetical protein